MSKRTRRYCLTLNNPQDAEIAALLDVREGTLKRGFVAVEVGAEGTTHLQGFVHLKNAKTGTALKTMLGSDRWHWEQAKGTDYENWAYIMEDVEGKVQGDLLIQWGDKPAEEGEPDAWESILQMIEDGHDNRAIVRKWPGIAIRCMAAIERYRAEYEWAECRAWRDVQVSYISGPTGCGKTREALYHADGRVNTDVYRCTNGKHPFDKYDGEGTIVFEEFRSQYTCRDMLNWIDGHPLMLPARYADRMAKFTTVIILSNWRFEEQYRTVQSDSPETYKAWLRRVATIDERWDS